MLFFREWLLVQEGRVAVPPGVLQGYESAFRQELRQLVTRTQDPRLKAVLTDMVDCPLRDRQGNCRSFTDFIMGALARNGIHHRYDMEAALGYIAEKMLMDRTDKGEPRASLFAGFEERPGYDGGNPLLARFLRFLEWAVANIRKGKIVRLRNTESRPQGTVSIGQGRHRPGDAYGGISPDEIEARPSTEGDLGEMVQDIEGLLRRRETEAGFPLVSLFKAIMSGQRTEQQRAKFEDRATRAGRQVIVGVIEDYARSSGNHALVNLLGRVTGEIETPRRLQVRPARPVLGDKERDYRSIVSVVTRFDRPVGTADLGRYRRRWLEYPPRQAGSAFRNRLEEVLAAMVSDGVLKATRTASGAVVYGPGPEFQAYQGQAVGV